MLDTSERQADDFVVEFTPEMRAAGARLMAAWDDEDAQDDLGSSYGNFVERLFREVLAHHSPVVSVRTQTAD
jgi:hypothetical protein